MTTSDPPDARVAAEKTIDEIYNNLRHTVSVWPELLMDAVRVNFISAICEAEKRGQEAMREAVCKLPNANVYAIHLVSVEAVRALTAREPGVTGKGEGE